MLSSIHLRPLRSLSPVLVIALVMPFLVTAGLFAQEAPDATPVATPVADDGSTVTFNPIADAYVVQTTPDQNYGRRDTLISDQDLMTIAYVQFEVPELDRRVENATFRIWVTNPTRSVPMLWITPAIPLDEGGVTWNTRPALDGVVEDKGAQGTSHRRWLEYDVSSVVVREGNYTSALVPTATDGIDFASREADELQPELILELGDDRLGSGLPPNPDDPPILLAAGDIATCGEGAEQTAQILDVEHGTIATLGDNAYGAGTAEQFNECYDPAWGRHRDRTMPTPGNHDYETEDAAPYFEYFGEAADQPDKGYYSYMMGAWKIIAINTNVQTKPDSEQMQWLRTELEGSDAQCTLVYGHHPRFSSGMHGSQDFMDPFFTMFYNYGVDIYLAGHDHNYERFRPQDPAGERDDEHGVRQFIVGTGGVALREFGEIVANSEVRSADALGIIRFVLYEDGYQFQFLAVEDESLYDSGEGKCNDAPDEPWSGEEEGRISDASIAVDPRRVRASESTFQRDVA